MKDKLVRSMPRKTHQPSMMSPPYSVYARSILLMLWLSTFSEFELQLPGTLLLYLLSTFSAISPPSAQFATFTMNEQLPSGKWNLTRLRYRSSNDGIWSIACHAAAGALVRPEPRGTGGRDQAVLDAAFVVAKGGFIASLEVFSTVVKVTKLRKSHFQNVIGYLTLSYTI